MTAQLIDSFVDRRGAQLSLEFAQLHDWGKDARIAQDSHGGYWLTNLVETYMDVSGTIITEPGCCPANMYDIRRFGGS